MLEDKWKKKMRNRSILLYLMIFSYSLSLPLESRQRLYITEASTLAGLYVFGSFSNDITDNRIVLFQKIQQFVYHFCKSMLH